MDEVKTTMRENLLALLQAKTGLLAPGENGTSKLAKQAGRKTSWGQRLLDDTDVGLKVLGEAARMFSLKPWQLLVPGLDPAQPPELSGKGSAWPFPMVSPEEYWSLTPEDRIWVQAKTDTAIKERMDAQRKREPVLPLADPEDSPRKRPAAA